MFLRVHFYDLNLFARMKWIEICPGCLTGLAHEAQAIPKIQIGKKIFRMTGLYSFAALLFNLRASAAILDQRIVQDRRSEIVMAARYSHLSPAHLNGLCQLGQQQPPPPQHQKAQLAVDVSD